MNEPRKEKRELKLLPEGEMYAEYTFIDPEDDLRNRFCRQKLEDLLNDNVKPFPTYLMEEEDPDFLELIRPFILFGNMKPFSGRNIKPQTRECLETKKIKNFGEMYGLIIPN